MIKKQSYYASIETIDAAIQVIQQELAQEMAERISPRYIPVRIKQHTARLVTLKDIKERIRNGDTDRRPGDYNEDL